MKLRDGWEIAEKGWYHNPAMNVSVLKCGKKRWESIASDRDDICGGPFFKTLTAAMEDAEKRAEK